MSDITRRDFISRTLMVAGSSMMQSAVGQAWRAVKELGY
jgi:hypothetical protein